MMIRNGIDELAADQLEIGRGNLESELALFRELEQKCTNCSPELRERASRLLVRRCSLRCVREDRSISE